MAVSGREQGDIPCKPCEDEERFTHAEGFCQECEEYMCKGCFNSHRKWKASRNHVLLGMNEEKPTSGSDQDNDKLEKCQQHYDEPCKFYCPVHDQIGCGDCMVLGHKACKVEYIRDKARMFKHSKEFKGMLKLVDDSQTEVKELASSISNSKIQVKDINVKFVSDVHIFRDKLIAHVNKLANKLIQKADKVKLKDSNDMEDLKKQSEDLEQEMARFQQEIKSRIDEPIKLVTFSILHRTEIKHIHEQLKEMKKRTTVVIYDFLRDDMLESNLKKCESMGTMRDKQQKQPDLPVVKTILGPKPQPLVDRQFKATNVKLDGAYISYNGNGDVGLYLADTGWQRTDNSLYCHSEIEIINSGQRGSIVLGLVCRDYPSNMLPGLVNYSIGYNTGNGWLYRHGRHTDTGVVCKVGDRVGCYCDTGNNCYEVTFTRNGKSVDLPNIELDIWKAQQIHMFLNHFQNGVCRWKL